MEIGVITGLLCGNYLNYRDIISEVNRALFAMFQKLFEKVNTTASIKLGRIKG
jgi:hypothetical protein